MHSIVGRNIRLRQLTIAVEVQRSDLRVSQCNFAPPIDVHELRQSRDILPINIAVAIQILEQAISIMLHWRKLHPIRQCDRFDERTYLQDGYVRRSQTTPVGVIPLCANDRGETVLAEELIA